MARLCRMTAVYGGGFRLVFRPRKTGPQSPPSLPKRRRSSYSNFRIVRCGGLWQEIRDQERPLSLKRDDLGILPNSGSIDGITPAISVRSPNPQETSSTVSNCLVFQGLLPLLLRMQVLFLGLQKLAVISGHAQRSVFISAIDFHHFIGNIFQE